MDFQKLVATRRGVRAYRPEPVPETLLAEVLEAARLAPSACNRQPFRVVVIRTRGREAAAFDPKAAREVLGLPESVVPISFTPLGWPLDSPAPKERRPLTDLVRYERWQGPTGS